MLHHYLDLPLDEVGRVLDIPTGTVKSRLSRALTEMRAALEADARPAVRNGAEGDLVTAVGEEVVR